MVGTHQLENDPSVLAVNCAEAAAVTAYLQEEGSGNSETGRAKQRLISTRMVGLLVNHPS